MIVAGSSQVKNIDSFWGAFSCSLYAILTSSNISLFLTSNKQLHF